MLVFSVMILEMQNPGDNWVFSVQTSQHWILVELFKGIRLGSCAFLP